jgi:hypothetical protein
MWVEGMRNKVILAVTIILASFLLAMPLIGCEGEISFTTASLSEATMCTAVGEDARPLDSTDVFAADTPEIFCSVKLSHAPSDTEVTAEWIYVGGEEDVTDYFLDDYTLTADGTRYLAFSLTYSDLWPRGDYKVVLYVDGKEKLSVPFTVE